MQPDIIFKGTPTDEQIETDPLGRTEYTYQVTKSTKDKLDLLDIKGELSASIMGGLIEVSGSGRYLKDTRTKVNSSSMTCRLYVQTEQDTIYLRKDSMKDIVDLNLLSNLGGNQEATHVVTSVLYGASGLVEAKYSFSDSQEQQRIEGSLGAKFQTIGLKIEGKGQLENDEKKHETYDNFTFSWKCDVGEDDANLPITFEDAVVKMTSLPTLIKGKDGEGRGVPIKVWLTPLSQIAEMYQTELQAHVIYSSIAEDSLAEIMSYYTKVEENVLKLQDLVANLTDDATLVRTEQVKKARDALTAGEKEKAKLQMTLKQALLDIRSGKEDTQGLDQWKIDFEDGVLSDSKIQETENEFFTDLKNKKLMTEAENKGVKVLRKGDFLPDDGHQYVLYTRIFEDDLFEDSNNHRNIFMRLQKTEKKIPKASSEEEENSVDDKTEFFWVDQDLWGQDVTDIMIIERRFGGIKDDNVKDRYEDELKRNLVDMSNGETWESDMVSQYAVNLEVKCPNFYISKDCKSQKVTWQCKKCKDEEKPIQLDVSFKDEGKIAIIVCTSCEMAYQFPILEEGSAFFEGFPSFKCDTFMTHGFTYVAYGDQFEAQIESLIQQIEDARNADQIPEDFDEHDLDGDGKLTIDEAKPLFRKVEDLAIELDQLKVSN